MRMRPPSTHLLPSSIEPTNTHTDTTYVWLLLMADLSTIVIVIRNIFHLIFLRMFSIQLSAIVSNLRIQVGNVTPSLSLLRWAITLIAISIFPSSGICIPNNFKNVFPNQWEDMVSLLPTIIITHTCSGRTSSISGVRGTEITAPTGISFCCFTHNT